MIPSIPAATPTARTTAGCQLKQMRSTNGSARSMGAAGPWNTAGASMIAAPSTNPTITGASPDMTFWTPGASFSRRQRVTSTPPNATSTKTAPWQVVPADDKYNVRFIVSRIVIDTLQRLNMRYPKLTHARRSELRVSRERLAT